MFVCVCDQRDKRRTKPREEMGAWPIDRVIAIYNIYSKSAIYNNLKSHLWPSTSI